jgi:hypothetical protein
MARLDIYGHPIEEDRHALPYVMEVQSDLLYRFVERLCVPLAVPDAFPGMQQRLTPPIAIEVRTVHVHHHLLGNLPFPGRPHPGRHGAPAHRGAGRRRADCGRSARRIARPEFSAKTGSSARPSSASSYQNNTTSPSRHGHCAGRALRRRLALNLQRSTPQPA